MNFFHLWIIRLGTCAARNDKPLISSKADAGAVVPGYAVESLTQFIHAI
jgi:hypothetical protein